MDQEYGFLPESRLEMNNQSKKDFLYFKEMELI